MGLAPGGARRRSRRRAARRRDGGVVLRRRGQGASGLWRRCAVQGGNVAAIFLRGVILMCAGALWADSQAVLPDEERVTVRGGNPSAMFLGGWH